MGDEQKDYVEEAAEALDEALSAGEAGATDQEAALDLHPVTIPGEDTAEESAPMADAWKEVGNQFAALGAGLAAALRTGWKNEESRRHLKEMRGGLEAMVNELGAAIREGTATPEAQKVKDEARSTVGTFRSAGEKTVQEIRPRIAASLNELNEEVRKLAGRMKKDGEAATDTTAAPEDKTTPPGDSSGPQA